MEWIDFISNNDNVINSIYFEDSYLFVHIKLWNDEIRRLKFINYHGLKEKNSIGEEIGDIEVKTESEMIDELRKDVLEGDGTIDEVADVKSIIFLSVWNEKVLLEILAENVEME